MYVRYRYVYMEVYIYLTNCGSRLKNRKGASARWWRKILELGYERGLFVECVAYHSADQVETDVELGVIPTATLLTSRTEFGPLKPSFVCRNDTAQLWKKNERNVAAWRLALD